VSDALRSHDDGAYAQKAEAARSSQELVSFNGVELYLRQIGHQDSMLAIRSAGQTIVNLNDCDTPASTLRHIRRDIGKVDLLMDQFSVAGWTGNPDDKEAKDAARRGVMTRLLRDVDVLDPRYVLPFASFVRFSHRENAHLNDTVNSVDDVAAKVDRGRLTVMYPGDSWDLGGPFAGTDHAMDRYRADLRDVASLPTKVHDPVPLKKVIDTAANRVRDLQAKYHSALLRSLPPVTFYVDDLETAIEVDVSKGVQVATLKRNECTLSLSSQAMFYAFGYRWGMPTLGVSGRFILNEHALPFFRLKKLCSLYAEGLFTRRAKAEVVPSGRLVRYLWQRRADLVSQFVRRVV
jgi:hypothetical protein